MPIDMGEVSVRLRRRAAFEVGALLLGAEALRRIALTGGATDTSALLMILVLAGVGGQVRLRPPRSQRRISLSFPFSFAAIVLQPPLTAFFLLAATSWFERLVGKSELQPEYPSVSPTNIERALEAGFNLAISACGVWAAHWVYGRFESTDGAAWIGGVALSAGGYFFVVSALLSIRDALAEGVALLHVWRQDYLGIGPVYLLAPVGALIVESIVRADSVWESLLGVALVALAALYLRSHFPVSWEAQRAGDERADLRERALETLAVAIEAKDGSTAGHLRRVKLLAVGLARRLGRPVEEQRALELAAVLHDVGKVGVPDHILMKPSRLTDEEFQEIATHAEIGAEIVANMDFPEAVEQIILCHHEHWDGSGYPRGLKGEEIPAPARVLTIVDCFDALISERPYRPAMSVDEAITALELQRGKIFDPAFLDVFVQELPGNIAALRAELTEESRVVFRKRRDTVRVRQSWIERDSPPVEIYARVRSLQRLSDRPQYLSVFYELMRLLGADLDFDRAFRAALKLLRTTCGATSASLFVYSAKRKKYVLQTSIGLPSHGVGRLTLPDGAGLVGRSVAAGFPLTSDRPPYEEDNGSAPRYFEDVRSTLAAPLDIEGRKVGVLLLCADHEKAFDADHGLLLSLITEKLAATVVAARQLRRIHIDANTDLATSLPNARASYVRLEQEIGRGEREGRNVGVFFMDLNGLKPVNDSYGHSAGDKLLTETAARLRHCLRGSDFVGRVGGDEFLAILPGLSPGHVERVRGYLRKALSSSPVEIAENVAVRPVISIGVAMFPQDSKDPDELIELSDKRMYEDKVRSRHAFFDEASELESETTAAGD